MTHKISLLIRADIDLDAIELVVTGCLTEQSVTALLEQIARARMLDPASPIRVDLTGAQHIEPRAVDVLHEHAARDPLTHRRALRVDLPEELPACPLESPVLPATSPRRVLPAPARPAREHRASAGG